MEKIKLEKLKNSSVYFRLKNDKKKSSLNIFLKNNTLNNIKSKIDLITSNKNTNIGIKNPKILFDFSSKKAVRFISAIMGDGEINSMIQVRYNNQDKELINGILGCAKHIFGNVDYKIYLREDKTYQLHFPKVVGLILLKLGLKAGYKSINNPKIPLFIMNLDENEKLEFIKQFFTDEGNVRLKDRRLQVKQTINVNASKKEVKLNPKKHCPRSLLGLFRLMVDVGLTPVLSLETYRKHKGELKADWAISIYGKENLVLFKKKIGFYLDYKNKQLDKAIKSYKFPSAPRNKRIFYALSKFMNVQKKEGFVTKYTLAEETKRSVKTATYYLIDLKKKKLIKEIERPKDDKGYFLPRKYKRE